MAAKHTFDIVSRVDMQEVDNAINQTIKEIRTRYDFKGSKSTVTLNQKEHHILVLADDEFKLKSVIDILENKLIRRNIPIKALTFGTAEDASGGMVRQTINLQSGIDRDEARRLVKMIKETKMKVQSAIQEDQVRVSGNKIDDLQFIITMLKDADLPFDMQFINFR